MLIKLENGLENKSTDTAGECTRIELTDWSLKIMKKFYLGETLSQRGYSSSTGGIGSGWSKFQDLTNLLIKAQGRLYSANACSAKLHGFETSPIKEKYMIRLVKTDERMVRQRCSVILQDSISAEELKTRLTLKSIKEGLENWRLQRFDHL